MGVCKGPFNGVGGDEGDRVTGEQHAAAHFDGSQFGHLAAAAHASVDQPEGGLFSKVFEGGKFEDDGIGSRHKFEFGRTTAFDHQ